MRNRIIAAVAAVALVLGVGVVAAPAAGATTLAICGGWQLELTSSGWWVWVWTGPTYYCAH